MSRRFMPRDRSKARIAAAVEEWERYVHSRARDYFGKREALRDVLEQIALYVDRRSDPILSREDRCCIWTGGQTFTGNSVDCRQTAIYVLKPGDSEKSWMNVTRLLTFLFAVDESFERVRVLPSDQPIKMGCGNQLCCSLVHVSLVTV